MSKNKSFWAWLLGGLYGTLKEVLKDSIEKWYVWVIYLGGCFTLFHASSIWMSYGDTIWNKPNAPYLCLLGIVLLFIGIYGHWRKNIHTSNQGEK